MSTTNYYDTFIHVAEDCPTTVAKVPPERGEGKTVARLLYEMIADSPYQHTSDDVVFGVFAIRHNVPEENLLQERKKFFSKGQPCLRTSPLCKQYGWGIHHDSTGKVAIYAMESHEYKRLVGDMSIKHIKAMRSARAERD
ncbi:MAG: DUF6157 family protein [Chloroflexi bacterium]|nr:DUF6157 family protein [Chloroflexota bacterium]